MNKLHITTPPLRGRLDDVEDHVARRRHVRVRGAEAPRPARRHGSGARVARGLARDAHERDAVLVVERRERGVELPVVGAPSVARVSTSANKLAAASKRPPRRSRTPARYRGSLRGLGVSAIRETALKAVESDRGPASKLCYSFNTSTVGTSTTIL